MGFLEKWKKDREKKRQEQEKQQKEMERQQRELEYQQRRQRRFPTIDFQPLPGCEQWQYSVVGESYRKKDIATIGTPNPDFKLSKSALYKKGLLDEPVYELIFPKVGATLAQEPTNKHDPNAIKVYMNGVHVGYIKARECSGVNAMINENRIRRIQGFICGGNTRTLSSGGAYYEEGEKNQHE